MKVNKTPQLVQDVEELKKQVENLAMALRVSQALLQQVLPGIQNMGNDIKSTQSMLNDFQYRFLAVQKMLNIDIPKMAAVASELKLSDWEKASDEDDVQQGFVFANKVESPHDIIIITSEVEGKPDTGIFRSKMVLAETGNQALIEALTGAEVGAKVSVELAGETHNITLLGVRRVKGE